MVTLRRDPRRLLSSLAREDAVEVGPAYTADERRSLAREIGAGQSSQSARAFRMGVDQVAASGVAARGLYRQFTGNEEGALDDFVRSQQMQEEAARLGPDIQTLEDIEGVGDALAWGRNMVLQQAPNIAVSAAGGGVGGIAARGAVSAAARRAGQQAVNRAAQRGASQAAGARLGDRAARIAAQRGTTASTSVGAAGAGSMLQAGQTTGMILDDDPNAAGTQAERARIAAATAIATGAVEALPITALFRRFGLTGPVAQQFEGNVLQRVARNAAGQGTSEAITEAAQTAGERLGHSFINDNIDVIGPEAYSDYLNAMAAGAVAGGVFGAPAGLRGAGRDSEAGKRLRESAAQWRQARQRPAEDTGQADAQTPGPVDAGPAPGIVQAVNQATETVRGVSSAAADRVKEATDKVAGRVQAIYERTKAESETNVETEHSIESILTATPYDFSVDENGNVLPPESRGVDPETGLPQWQGFPFARFADGALARRYVNNGYDGGLAAVMSTVADERARMRLLQSGALGEAAKALRGEDPTTLDNTLLIAYERALPSDARAAFDRAAITSYAIRQSGNEPLAREAGGAVAMGERGDGAESTAVEEGAAERGSDADDSTGDILVGPDGLTYQDQQAMDEQRPMRVSADAIRSWRQNAGKPIPRGTPQNTIMVRDSSGTRRGISGAQLGRMVVEARNADPELAAAPPLVQIAEILSDFAQHGYTIEPESIRAMELGRDWTLTPAQAAQLEMGMRPHRESRADPDSFRLRQQTQNVPSQRPRSRAEDGQLTREANVRDRDDVVEGGEGVVDDASGRGTGETRVPRGLPPQGTRATGGRTPSDRRASRVEGAQRATQAALSRVDDAIAQARGQRSDFRANPETGESAHAARRAAVVDVMNDPRVSPSLKQRIRGAMQAYAEAREAETAAAAPRRGESERATTPEPARVRVQEGQTIDANQEVDQDALRAERAQFDPGDFGELDALLRRYTGEVPQDFDHRRDLMRRVMTEGRTRSVPADARRGITSDIDARGRVRREGARTETVPLTSRERAELEDAAARFGDAQLEAALRNLRGERARVERLSRKPFERRTLKEKRQLAQARGDLREAERRYDAALEGALRGGDPDASAPQDAFRTRVTPAQEARNAPRPKKKAAQVVRKKATKKAARRTSSVDTEGSIDYSATLNPSTARDTILSTRSRRGLHAQREAIANSTLPEATKQRLDQLALDRLAALSAETTAAARAEVARNQRRTATAEHFNKAARALRGDVSTVEDGLRALRSLATPAQRRLIDTLVGMEGLDAVPLHISSLGSGVEGGLATGGHSAPTSGARAAQGEVTIRLAQQADGPSLDLVQLLLHEAIHAATAHAEQNNPTLRRDLERLLEHARERARAMGIDPDTYYGLAETQEFLAEAFTNDNIRDLLSQMPAANTSSFQNLWQEFMDFVRQLIGLSPADATVLDEVTTLGLALARETSAARAEAYARVIPTAESVDTAYAASPLSKTTAAGAKPTDYMGMLSPANRRYLSALFLRGDVYRQIKAALPPHLHRALDSADRGPELLVNTGMALAFQGKLDVRGTGLRAALNNMWDVVSKVLQVPTRAAYGRELLRHMTALKKPSRARREKRVRSADAHDLTLTAPAAAVTRWINANVVPKASAFFQDMDGRMRNTGIPALTQLATLISQRTGEFRADGQHNLIRARQQARNQRLSNWFSMVEGWDDKTKAKVARELARHNANPEAKLSKKAQQVRDFYEDMYDYATKAGIRMSKVAGYTPLAVDSAKIAADKEGFEALMNEFGPALKRRNTTAEKLWRAASAASSQTFVGTTTFTDGDHKPGFKYANQRLMDFVYRDGTPEQKARFAKYLDTNLDRVAVQYIDRATRRAEWERLRLDDRIKRLLNDANAQGASAEQLDMARDYIDQVMGVHGTDWHPMIARIASAFGVELPEFSKVRNLQQAVMTYQNLRLLPLALMSSFVDPLGAGVRASGGGAKMLRSYRDALRAMRDKQGNDALRALGESLGLVDRTATADALAYLYGSQQDPTSLSAKINSALFRFNGLETMTRYSRLAALAMGNRFLQYHAAQDTPESRRYLRELGLNPTDVVVGADGFVVRSARVDAALNRFVDESVVRPHAGQRPGWHNDPHFALAAQYRGFLYGFWNTVARRGMLEIGRGNYRALVPLISYIPVMMAGEMLRDALQFDDDDREFEDYAWLGIERSGLLGPRVAIGLDAHSDRQYGSSIFNSVAGPTAQQLGNAYDTVMNSRSAARTAHEALPGYALHKSWFSED